MSICINNLKLPTIMNNYSSRFFFSSAFHILSGMMILLFLSCSPKNYTFMDKKVTKKQFDRKLHQYTVEFLEKNPEFVQLWNDVEVVYDTIPH